ncbi:Probable plastid-lipid-associated protein 12, chloroplastic [Ancistrocladus abbreviatus]
MEAVNLGFRLSHFRAYSPLLNPCCLSPRHFTFSCRRNPQFRIRSSSLVRTAEEQEGIRFTKDENRLVEALVGIQGRGRSASPQQIKDVERAVQVLEDLKGVPEPTNSSLIEGRWQLMFTTRPGTASPIQRTFVGVDFFSIFQEVYLRSTDPRVSNIVKFSDAIGELKVEAAASVEDGKRILFQFDRAAFSLKFLPFKVPYPVPFRLLGDEAKGWLDTTYLSHSGHIRISRGSKGTTFVLQKETEPRQQLLSAISTGSGVKEAIEKLINVNKDREATKLELSEGEWKMLWSSQMETDSWLENAANGLMGTQIIKTNGQLKFLVDILLGFRFSMIGKFLRTESSSVYEITMDDAAIIFGSFGLPIEMESKFNLELLYIDDKIRITRGYNKIVFVHLRVDQS